MEKKETRTVAANRKAYHDYFVDETYEAGIALYGTEVKSIRLGAVNLKDSYCFIKDGEIFVRGMQSCAEVFSGALRMVKFLIGISRLFCKSTKSQFEIPETNFSPVSLSKIS